MKGLSGIKPLTWAARRRHVRRGVGCALALVFATAAHAALASSALPLLECGVPIPGTLGAQSVDNFVVAAQEGRIVVDVVDPSGAGGLIKLTFPQYSEGTCTGTQLLYFDPPQNQPLEVSSCFGHDVGYTINANVVSAGPSNCGRPMPCGITPFVRRFAIPGEVDAYTFAVTAGDRVTLTANNITTPSEAVRLRLYDPDGIAVPPPPPNQNPCSPTQSLRLGKTGTYTVLVSACGAPKSGLYGIALQAPSCPEGPDITAFGLARADGSPIAPVDFDDDGRPIYQVTIGAGFFVVTEAQPGRNGKPVGPHAYNYDPADPTVLPDLQVLFARPLGDGSRAVCDKTGGVPATSSLDYDGSRIEASAINDFGCRVDDGQGNPEGRTKDYPCTFFPDGDFHFVNPRTTLQFCAPISLPWGFPPGETVLRARARDTGGVVGAPREIIVRLGDADQPRLVKDISQGSNSSSPRNLVMSQGKLAFAATTPDTGEELFRGDGSTAGTGILKDIRPGSASSSPAELTSVASTGRLFLTADDGVAGAEPWTSAGSSTTLVADVQPGPGPARPNWLTALGDTVFFAADDGTTGSELWISGGDSASTYRVRDINPGPEGSAPANLTAVGPLLFFAADDGISGFELWKSDRSEAGTVLVKDIFPGEKGSLPGELVNANGFLIFAADDGTHGVELWRSDGTADGTTLIADIVPGSDGSAPRHLVNIDGSVYFAADDGTHGIELWRSDGTAAGTLLVKDIATGTADSLPELLTNVAGRLFFTADDGLHGRELWTSTGSAAGTVLVKDIIPGSASSAPTALTNVAGTLVFTAADAAHGREPWRSDGTAAGTARITDINAGPNSSEPAEFVTLGSQILFAATTVNTGRELWALTAPPTPDSCAGDCSADGEVTIDELVTGVRIALGEISKDTCTPMDTNTDGEVTIEEILQAVNTALAGCPAA